MSMDVDVLPHPETMMPPETVTGAPLARTVPTSPAPVVPRTVVMPASSPTASSPAPEVLSILQTSDQCDLLFAALAKAQAKFGTIEKKFTANVASRKGEGSSYSYKYADLQEVLGAIRPALAEEGLCLIQAPATIGKRVTVRTILGHSSGQWLRNDLSSEVYAIDPQSIGGAVTYLRRYAALSLAGAAAGGDDDAVAASRRRPEPEARRPERHVAPSPDPVAKRVGKVAWVKVTPSQDAWVIQLADGYQVGTKAEHWRDFALNAQKQDVAIEVLAEMRPGKKMPMVTELVMQVGEPPASGASDDSREPDHV